MRVLWTLLKVVIVLALAIPVSIFVLAAALGILGTLVGLAFLVFKFAVIGLIAWGCFSLIARLLGGPKARTQPVHELPHVDPYYEAAKRELDRDLGEVR